MNAQSSVTLLKQLEVTDLSGEKVMIDFDTGKYFMLKGAANEIWDVLKEGITVGEIVAALRQLYDVEEDVCQESVISFLNQLEQYGFAKVQ